MKLKNPWHAKFIVNFNNQKQKRILEMFSHCKFVKCQK